MVFGFPNKHDRKPASAEELVALRVSSMREALRWAIADCFRALGAPSRASDDDRADPVRGVQLIVDMRVAGYASVLRDIGVRESEILAEVRQASVLWIDLRPDAPESVREQVLMWTSDALRAVSRSAPVIVPDGVVLPGSARVPRERPVRRT